MRSINVKVLVLTAALFALALPVFALAQVVIPDPANTDAFLQAIVAAIAGGEWRVAVVLVAVGAVYLLRTFGARIPGALGVFLGTSRGGALLALVFSFVTGLGTLLLAGQPVTLKAVLDLLLLGFTAIGGWVGVRRILGLDVASKAAATFKAPEPGTAASAAAELGRPPQV